MAEIGSIRADILLDIKARGMRATVAEVAKVGDATEGYAESAEEASEKTLEFSASLGKSGKQYKVTADGLQTVATKFAAIGTAAAAGLTAAANHAREFNTAMAEVSTLTPKVADNMGVFKDQVLEVSATMGKDAVESANAMYQAISAGVDPSNVKGFLELASKAAIGGVTDMTTAVDGLTTATNAWKGAGLDAKTASDVLFTGMKLGKTTIGELSESMYKVAPLAADMGVSIQEVTAATTTLTKSGTPTSVAMNQVQRSLVTLKKNGDQLQPVLDHLADKFPEMGEATGQAALDTFGYQRSMKELAIAAGELGISLPAAFGEIEGAMAATTLAGNWDTTISDLTAVQASAGATEEAYQQMAATAEQKIAVMKETFNAVAIQVGDHVLPMIGAVAEKISGLAAKFQAMSPEGQKLVVIFASLVAGGATLIGTIAGIGAATLPAIKSMRDMGVSVARVKSALMGLGPAAGVIGALVAILAVATVSVQAWNAEVAKSRVEITGAQDRARALEKQLESGTITTLEYKEQMAALAQETGVTAEALQGSAHSFDTYRAAVDRASESAGIFDKIGKAITQGLGESANVKEATQQWLQYGLGVDEAVLSSKEFKAEQLRLNVDLNQGRITSEQYRATLVELANEYSIAAGKGAVMTETQRELAAETREALIEAAEHSGSLDEATIASQSFQSAATNAANAVAMEKISLDEANNALAITGERLEDVKERQEAQARATAVSTGALHEYSDSFIDMVDAGKGFIADEKERTEAIEELNVGLRQGLESHLGEMLSAADKYHEDLERARQEDANAVQAAAKAKQNAITEKEQQIAQMVKRQERSKSDSAWANAQDRINAARQELEEIRNSQITIGGSRVAEVKRQWQETHASQKEALAQMVVDHIKSMVLMGQTSEETAKAIFGELQNAFPGVEVVDPAEEAMLGLFGTIHRASQGSQEDIEGIGASINSVVTASDTGELGGVMVEIRDESTETALQWHEDAQAMAESRQTAAGTIVLTNQQLMESDGELTAAVITGTGARHNADLEYADHVVDTSATVQQQHGNVVTSTTTLAETTDEELSRMRDSYSQTAGTSRGATEDIQRDADTIGESVGTAGRDAADGLSAVGSGITGVASDIETAADQGASGWEEGQQRIRRASQETERHLTDGKASYEDIRKATAAQGDDAEESVGKEVEAHANAVTAVQDHRDVVLDATDEMNDALDETIEQVELLGDAYDDLPRNVTTRLAIQNYEDTYEKLQTLMEAAQSIAGTLTISVETRHDPQDEATGPGNSFIMEGWLKDLRKESEQPMTLTLGADIDPMLQRASPAPIEEMIAWLREQTGHSMALDIAMDSPNLQAWSDLIERISEFREEMEGLVPLVDELERFFTEETDNDSWASIFADMTKGGKGADPIPQEMWDDINGIRDEMMEALASGDAEEFWYQWERFYDKLEQAEKWRHEQRLDNLDDEMEKAKDNDDKHAQESIQKVIDSEKGRHEDVMRDLEAERGRVEEIYEAWEHEQDRLDDMQREAERARKEFMRELKAAQKDAEDFEKQVHEDTLERIEEEMDALERKWAAQQEWFDRRRKSEDELHDRRLYNLDEEKAAVEDQIADWQEHISDLQQQLKQLKLPRDMGGLGLEEMKQDFKDIQDFIKTVEKFAKEGRSSSRSKRKVTGPRRIRVTDQQALDALRKAANEGQIADPRLLSLAQEILAGSAVRADYIAEVFQAIASEIESSISAAEKRIKAKEDEIALEQYLLGEEQKRWDEELEQIEQRRERENQRHEAAVEGIAAEEEAARQKYENEKQALEEAKRIEKERHEDRMEQIAQEYALALMLAEGLSPEEAQARVDAAMARASQIGKQAAQRYRQARDQGERAAYEERRRHEARVASQGITSTRRSVGIVGGTGAVGVGGGGARGMFAGAFAGGGFGLAPPPGAVGAFPTEPPSEVSDPIVEAIHSGLGPNSPIVRSNETIADELRNRIPHKREDAKRPFMISRGGWTGIISPTGGGGLGPVPYHGSVSRPGSGGLPPGVAPMLPDPDMAPGSRTSRAGRERDAMWRMFQSLTREEYMLVPLGSSNATQPASGEGRATGGDVTLYNYGTIEVSDGGGEFRASVLDQAEIIGGR